MLKYLENNKDIPYSNPESKGISEEKKKELLAIKRKGQAAVAEMRKMALFAEKLYGLDKCLPAFWLDGSNTRTRKYLWTQMKYKANSDNPISVSIFAQNWRQEKASFLVCLEIKNDKSNKEDLKQFHSHLEVPKKDGLVYKAVNHPEFLNEDQKDIISKIEDGTYNKVQICKIIEQKDGKTNDDYHKEVMTAISEIIPYYNHVLGITKKLDKKRGWILIWNPESWIWEKYEEWCVGTKKGKKYTIDWTCNTKQPKIGDDIFLMKTGKQPRGIIAHGYVATEAYESKHYNEEKALQGITSNHIDVAFDWIQNFNNDEKILLQDDLKEKYPHQTWSPRGSGIEIREDILTLLKDDWEKLIGISKY